MYCVLFHYNVIQCIFIQTIEVLSTKFENRKAFSFYSLLSEELCLYHRMMSMGVYVCVCVNNSVIYDPK